MADDLTSQGIAALEAGDKAKAHQLLEAAVATNPSDETAWIWLSGAVDTDEERAKCLQRVLEINPNSRIAKMGLASLGVPYPLPSIQEPTKEDVIQEEGLTSDEGYIYVLINPSMDGLVKVGKTTRDPEGRARELSASTGIPTPFYLAYKTYFRNCSKAEQYVHTRLEQKDYRVTRNREFFRASLDEVVEIVLEARKLDGQSEATSIASSNVSSLADSSTDTQPAPLREPWRGALERADAYLGGLGDTIQDYTEALRLYKQAERLGCDLVFQRLGLLYALGMGCKQDVQKALEYLRQGANTGDGRCWAEMAKIYFNQGNFDNSNKCWKKYFESAHFKENIPEDKYWPRSAYAVVYMRLYVSRGDFGHHDKLSSIKPELIRECDVFMREHKKRGNYSLAQQYRIVLEAIKKL